MDIGAWRATVRAAAESQTRLRDPAIHAGTAEEFVRGCLCVFNELNKFGGGKLTQAAFARVRVVEA